MKARGISSWLRLVVVFNSILLVAPATLHAQRLHNDDEPPATPGRIVVKLTPALARGVEQALPAGGLVLRGPFPPALDVLEKNKVRELSPVYRGLADAGKRGLRQREVTGRVKQQFARRSARVPAGIEPPDLSRSYILEVDAANPAELDRIVASLKREPQVEHAAGEQLVWAQFTPNDPYFSTSGSWGQSYADLYGLHKLQSSAAWDLANGSGIVVAVVDTGADYNHPDLSANVWSNTGEIAGNGMDDDGNGYVDDIRGWDFVGANYLAPAPDNNPADPHGHGTHVAGTVAATGNNGVGVIGVAWGASIMPVRGLDNGGTGTDAMLADAIVYAANNGADVINCSFGGPGTSQILLDAVNYAHALGCVVVVSAGNADARTEGYFPASFANVITVAATTATDGRASFSNWGSKLDVAAPGEDILSLRAAGTSRGPLVGTQYTRLSGTSMAAPHVSGVAALILSQSPGLTPEQVRQVIRASADDVSLAGVDEFTGAGRVNAAQALNVPDALEAKIQGPAEGSKVAAPIAITGVAQGPGFSQYVLEYGTGEWPAAWTVIQQSSLPVNGGQLGVFDPSQLPDGRHSLRLRAYNASGELFQDRLSVIVDYVQITSPVPPMLPSASQSFKAGATIPIYGTANGPSFSQYRVEWARGINPASGWASPGVTLVNGGASAVSNGLLANWDTSGVTAADFYTVRVLVDNAGFTSEARTVVYLEPALLSSSWPQWLGSIPSRWASPVPVKDAAGNTLLALALAPYPGQPLDAPLRFFTPEGEAVADVLLNVAASTQPAVANLDGQPGEEVVIGDDSAVHVIRPDFTVTSLTPAQPVTFRNSHPVLEDLDGDGQFEILIIGTTNRTSFLYAWQPSGQQLTPNFPISLVTSNFSQRDYSNTRFLAVDLNQDGLKEILVAESRTWTNWTMRLFNFDGSPSAWPDLTYPGFVREMVVGDLERDGEVDIVVAYLDNNSIEHWLVLRPNGSLKPGWPKSSYPYLSAVYGSKLALADLDRDGSDELVVSSAGQHKLFVFRADGSPLSAAWPVSAPNMHNIAVADVDGDGYPEVVGARSEYLTSPNPLPLAASDLNVNYTQTVLDTLIKLVAVRWDGVIVKSWTLTGAFGYSGVRESGPSLGDFDNDGMLDVAVWQALSGGAYGTMRVMSLGTPVNSGAMDWPLNFHDSRNTSASLPVREAPIVRIVAPAAGATVSGNVTVTATASDNVAVVGVQFYLDGAPLGAEDLSAPYAVSWNTAGSTPGSHTLTAVVRDGDGNVTTSAPISVTVSAPAVPPSAPSGLAATAVSKTQINLAWSDNSSNETGFKIERSTNNRSWTQIATVGSNVRTYSDTGLAKGKVYYHRVRAFNPNGDSAYSNVASAKTFK